MSEWKEYKISDVADVIGGGTPRTSVSSYWNGNISWITPRDLSNNRRKYISKGERNISQSGLQNSNAKLLPKGTVLLSSRAPIGYLAIAENEITTNQGFQSLIPDNGKTTTEFLYYLLKNNIDYLVSQGTGTTFGELSKSTLKEIMFNFPPLSEQKSIASVLSSLDDKIDLLHRQNSTLEKMAETLFRQWFVEEEKEEWEEGKLSDLVFVKYGKDHKKLLDGKIPVFGSGGLMRYAEKSLYDKESVLIPRKGTLSNVMYQDEPFWTVDTMFYTEMKVPNVAKFVYHFLIAQDLASMNVGSAVPSMTTEILNNMPLDIPPKKVFEKFEGAVAPLYSKMKSNQNQISTLTALRDTLLPKLMSGEVRVEM